MKLPSISVVIATYNSAKTLRQCLVSIRTQEYPEALLHIILADGGSTDKTRALAKEFGATVCSVDTKKQGAEYNRAVGAHASKDDLLLFVDHDNVLPHRGWLRKMVQPILDNPKIVGVETLRYGYDPKDALIGRYFSLFGVNDIFSFYLGKADRLSYMFDTPSSYGVFRQAEISKADGYYVVSFSPKAIPTLGANGFLIRRLVLFSHAHVAPDEFFHIDVNVDLIRSGKRTYAFISDVLHHKSDERGLFDYLKRRKLFMETYHFKSSGKRRYSLYEPADFWKTIAFILSGLTFVVPFIDAVKGYRKIRDVAWFLNPLMCFLIVMLYGSVIIQRKGRAYAHTILAR